LVGIALADSRERRFLQRLGQLDIEAAHHRVESSCVARAAAR
jgi:hypothetical protein